MLRHLRAKIQSKRRCLCGSGVPLVICSFPTCSPPGERKSCCPALRNCPGRQLQLEPRDPGRLTAGCPHAIGGGLLVGGFRGHAKPARLSPPWSRIDRQAHVLCASPTTAHRPARLPQLPAPTADRRPQLIHKKRPHHMYQKRINTIPGPRNFSQFRVQREGRKRKARANNI